MSKINFLSDIFHEENIINLNDNEPDTFYRFETCDESLEVIEFKIWKRTPKGVWLVYPYEFTRKNPVWKKFVLLGRYKQFAYAEKRKALNSFIKRKKRQIEILTFKLKNAKITLAKANDIQST